jgi:hypothetical protein
MPKCPHCGHEFYDHPSNMLESEKIFWEKAKTNLNTLYKVLKYGPFVLVLFLLHYLLAFLGYVSLSSDQRIQLPLLIVLTTFYLWYVRKQLIDYKELYEKIGLWDYFN